MPDDTPGPKLPSLTVPLPVLLSAAMVVLGVGILVGLKMAKRPEEPTPSLTKPSPNGKPSARIPEPEPSPAPEVEAGPVANSFGPAQAAVNHAD